ncbi:MAG: tetratricopeptide repeat protein [Candidatus Eisenbacteria bacterium]
MTESPQKGPEGGALPEQEARAEVREITVEEAVQMGIRHHRAGRLAEAEYIYGKVLEAVPNQPDALHFLGVVAHQLGRSDEAIERIQSAIALDPGHADMHNNLGRILMEQGRTDGARDAFEQAISLAPDASADAWNNLGTLYKRAGEWAEAGDAFQHAIRLHPDHADAHQNLGNVFRRAGHHAQAAACFRRAIELKPDAARDYQNLSQALWRAGQEDEARAAVKEWLAYDSESAVAQHLAAAFGISESIARASDEFVSSHFDEHAESFDEHLAELQYQAPEKVGAMLRRSLGWDAADPGADVDSATTGHAPARQEEPSPPRLRTILDAGCGTGLCGPLLSPLCDRLVGVDLSAGMVKKAEGRGYHDLVVAELTAFLEEHPLAYGAVVSADTLCYFGDLSQVTDAAWRSLEPGGWFVFTVESLDAVREDPANDGAEPFRLQFHGRYAHSKSHIDSTLQQVGFESVEVLPEVLRMEVGEPVHGWLARGRKPSA